LNELGVAATQAGRFDDAEKHLTRALEMRQKILEPNSYYTAITLGALGDLARAQKRYAQAEGFYRRAVAQWESSGRDAQASIETITEGYVAMLQQQGRTREAAAIQAKAR
jgi:tetratricopeptide (TPR) repeat protein